MAIRNIRITGDPILEKISKEVREITPNIHRLLDDMGDTMKERKGVGLAAVQVGVLRRVIMVLQEDETADLDDLNNEEKTIEADQNEATLIELINPEIIALEGVQEDIEGCLSIPGQAGVVARPEKITVKAQNRLGEWFEITGEGRLAICLNHELDHLDGVLYTDKVLYMVDENDEPIID